VLRVGPIWKTSDPIADAEAVHQRPSGLGAWGEGLVDRSLASLWYAGKWSEVGDDELVFMLPTLSTWRPESTEPITRGGEGPDHYLTRVLTARAQATAALISSNMTDPETGRSQALELLVARAIVTAVPLKELKKTSASSACGPRLPSSLRSGANTAASLPDWLALELTALAHLDRLLLDARGTRERDAPPPLVDWPLTLTDVVLVTINARLNGLYVHPEFAHAHELLTAAALLGHLACGRAAYLPPAVAQSLADILSGRAPAAPSDKDGCASIVKLYAELAGGADRLLSSARRTAASGRPCLIKPSRPIAPADIGRTTWNARLLRRVSARWQVSV
jgi:hypothetical protein